ncbi:MAG: ferritin-like domain-containing protein [Alphaproteobacteria bacterium]|nr:ferritin-like domain-containing protein [Alphaproteobacteria bacterium]
MLKHWSLDDIEWHRFDRSKVDGRVLDIVRAASMVEYNSGDYVTYLCNIFADDEEFKAAAVGWGAEEQQHGMALARWAQLADPSFDFQASFAAFLEGFRPEVDVRQSIRGTRTAELLSRCMVEIGTSSFYSAIRDATEEPVLRQICARIARDEFAHYGLFRRHMQRYLEIEQLNLLVRLKTLIARALETTDDELGYAYHAGNRLPGAYNRKKAIAEYAARALGLYQRTHVDTGVTMILKAAGLEREGWLHRQLSALTYRILQSRARRLRRAVA